MMVYYFPQYIKNRKDANIHAQVIQEASSQTEELKKKDKENEKLVPLKFQSQFNHLHLW